MYEICLTHGQSSYTHKVEANAINTIAEGRVIQFINKDKVVFSIGVDNLIYYKYIEPKPESTKTIQEVFLEFAYDQNENNKLKNQAAKIEEKKSKFDKFFSPKKK